MMCGPKRVPFKNIRECRDQYRQSFLLNFLVGAALSWPLAVVIGRRSQRYQGGVPVSHFYRHIEHYNDVSPIRAAQKNFRNAAGLTVVAGGFIFAYYFTDASIMRNKWYTRPDFAPKAAMIRDEDNVLYDK